MSGDTIQGGNDATAASEWRALRPLWDRYRYPLYFTPGNHDIWSPASRAVYEQQTRRPAFYGFNYQNAHFTVLDNSQSPDLSGDLSDRQMQFLARDLAQNRDRDPEVCFLPQAVLAYPGEISKRPFSFSSIDRQVRRALRGQRPRTPVRARRAGWRHVSGSAQLGRQAERAGLRQGWFYGHVLVTVKGSNVDMAVQGDRPAFRPRPAASDLTAAPRSTAAPAP